jgi:hypothetical protein
METVGHVIAASFTGTEVSPNNTLLSKRANRSPLSKRSVKVTIAEPANVHGGLLVCSATGSTVGVHAPPPAAIGDVEELAEKPDPSVILALSQLTDCVTYAMWRPSARI